MKEGRNKRNTEIRKERINAGTLRKKILMYKKRKERSKEELNKDQPQLIQ